MPKPFPPWWEVARPHPKSSRLSRFRTNVQTSSATDATPKALNLHQARCEVNASNINLPIRIVSHFSSTEAILSIPSMGGWKNRTPILTYFIDAEPVGSRDNYTTSHALTVGLADIAYYSAIDPSRKLLFTGDDDRVKSFTTAQLPTELLQVSTAYISPSISLPKHASVYEVKSLPGKLSISSHLDII